MSVKFYLIFIFDESLPSFLLFCLWGLLRHAQGGAKWQPTGMLQPVLANCRVWCVCVCIWARVPPFEVEQQLKIQQLATSVLWRHHLVKFSSVAKDHTQRTNIHLCWVKYVRFPPSFFSFFLTSDWNLVLTLCSWLLGLLFRKKSQSPMRTSTAAGPGGNWLDLCDLLRQISWPSLIAN